MAKAKFGSYLLVIVSLCCLAAIANSAARVNLSKAGMNFAKTKAIGQLSRGLKGTKLPDIKGEAKVLLGKIKYAVTKMKVTSFKGPSSSNVKQTSDGFIWTTEGTKVGIKGKWRWQHTKLKFLKDNGSFTLKVDDIDITVTVALSFDSNGKPKVSIKKCKSDIGSVDIKFKGGLSWLYNLFTKYIERKLDNRLEKAICKGIKKVFTKKMLL